MKRPALVSTVCLMMLLTNPCPTSAFVIPYAAIQTIAGILSLISGGVGTVLQSKWESEASGKLDKIIEQNGTILSELRDLKIFVPQALEAAFKQEVAIKINSYSTLFDQYMARSHPSAVDFRAMRLQVALTSYDILQRGPSVYLSAAAAAVLTLGVFEMSEDTPPEDRKFFLDKMISAMRQWSSDEPGMFGGAIKEQSELLNKYKGELSSIPRGSDVVIYSARSTIDIIGGLRPDGSYRTYPCTLKMHANVVINEVTLETSVAVTKIDGCDTGSFDERTQNDKTNEYKQSILYEMAAIKNAQDRLNELTMHRNSLLKIISDLQMSKP